MAIPGNRHGKKNRLTEFDYVDLVNARHLSNDTLKRNYLAVSIT
jgi:hypothetical protein